MNFNIATEMLLFICRLSLKFTSRISF